MSTPTSLADRVPRFCRDRPHTLRHGDAIDVFDANTHMDIYRYEVPLMESREPGGGQPGKRHTPHPRWGVAFDPLVALDRLVGSYWPAHM